MTGESYKDRDGNPTTLEELCRTEPDWACSRIRHMRAELDTVKKERDEARREASHTRRHSERILGLEQPSLFPWEDEG